MAQSKSEVESMMRKLNRWLGATTALAASLFLWSCDDVGEVTQPQLEPSPMVVTSTRGQKYVVAYERSPESGTVSATIGPDGGVIGLGRHAVSVSKNAVSEPTVFTITRAPEEALRVKLTAGENNAVGAAGFNAPVVLSLSMGDASNAPADRKDAKIIYFRNDGQVDVLDTRVYGNMAAARLTHFSLYGLGWP